MGGWKYDIELLEYVVDLFNAIPEFLDFLERKKYDSYELAFPTFGFIVNFLDYLSWNRDIQTLKKVLWYLEYLKDSKDDYKKNLLFVWVLENFDCLSSISFIIPFMSDWLRKDFIENFPQYSIK